MTSYSDSAKRRAHCVYISHMDGALIKGCASSPIPTWAYLMLTAELSQVAEHILYGEPCAAVKVFSKN